ncbi:MAG: thioredoxin domain-containing protein [Proteobacteria bacterium]|nr:thioredoxin domain-containing protein [Pseudomonadota bacterium]
MSKRTSTNRLIHETSPYLRKHAHNPVDWFAWGPEALEKARAEGKPIHLSVGYASCHWCSILEKESFEDEATARILNDNFVNIKVDREERPDIDRIYQIAQQLITQRSGGWPLTMFLAHEDQRPFFGGTYFPKEPRYGLPAFKDLLLRVAQYYRERPQELRTQNEALVKAFDMMGSAPAPEGTVLDDSPVKANRAQLARLFDPKYGGFGGAPKFPQPQMLTRLLRDWRATAHEAEPDLRALYMATFTLRHMADGGLNDQLGGGFCRYTVDEQWMIPHFEKMLYDNAGLMALYAQAAIASGDADYAHIAGTTASYVQREMQSLKGGFYSSFDADSEGHEGKFYVWSREEVRAALTPEEYAAFAPRYGLDREPNFEGRWHLFIAASLEDAAAAAKVSPAEVSALLESARTKLLLRRAQRVPPARDDKVLTSWNGLMIRALAVTARSLGRPDLAEAASRSLDFIRANLWRNGRLLATSMDGRSHLNAYLDDYVFLADAILELQQVRFRAEELSFAQQLIEVVLARFADPGAGGFFFTADDHEKLIHRSKVFSDDATPAGNGIAAFVLQRLGYLLAEPRYLAAAEATLRAAWGDLNRYPQSHATLLNALEEYVHAPQIVILRGENAVIGEWQRELARLYAPRRLVLAIPAGAAGLPAALSEKAASSGPLAYVCTGSTCAAPVGSLAELLETLRTGEPA